MPPLQLKGVEQKKIKKRRVLRSCPPRLNGAILFGEANIHFADSASGDNATYIYVEGKRIESRRSVKQPGKGSPQSFHAKAF